MKIAASLLATLALVASTVVAGPTNGKNKHHHQKYLRISKKVLRADKVPFIPHSGSGLFTNWVGMNLDFKYVKPFVNMVNSTASLNNNTALISRGEAHITMITPPEYDNILSKAGVTIKELNAIATNKKRPLQRAKFSIPCLGRVQAVTKPDNVFQQSWQLIVNDDKKDLLRYRQDVFKLFVKKGGNPALFDPEDFMPHITLGFKTRDLFVEDGVYKRRNACIAKVVAV
ncbi:hypothetical protein DFQ27_003488 [Actinomortierella ambigua]|uniref:Swiss Army Knife 2H phosphoesterase domain-containing protein n=1 Tax=Actinomortierella ambigua TaxID=1343610 RepID=A0A9P6Q7Z6_9FUNG|nr:hypothetical protein DFQ27_003488 [Actinomortierella ambigua]